MPLCATKCLGALALSLLAAGGPAAALAQRAPDPAAAVIQPGDRIVIKIWQDKLLTDTAAVDQHSGVVLPQLGLVSLDSQPVGSLPDSIRARYALYFRNTSIDVAVLRRVGVLGEVKKPALYWLDVTMTLPDAVALAGGVTDIGNSHDVRIVRDGRQTRVPNWETGGTVGTELLSGDQIVVGRTSWLSRNALTVISGIGVFASITFALFRL